MERVVSKDSVIVFAPATVANIGAGFDVLGLAIDAPGDVVLAKKIQNPGIKLKSVSGDNGSLSKHDAKNVVEVVGAEVLRAAKVNFGVELELQKGMPIGSGLGSSAASCAAAAVAVNAICGDPFSRKELVTFAMEGERAACGSAHADNVAPSLLGGAVLIRSYDPLDIISLPVPEDLFVTVVHPDVAVNTSDARKVLKSDLELSKAIKQWGNVAGLVAGFCLNDTGLILRSVEDFIIAPARGLLIPGYRKAKDQINSLGSFGFGISGSGPSLFCLSGKMQQAKELGEVIQRVFKEEGISSQAYCSAVNRKGALIKE